LGYDIFPTPFDIRFHRITVTAELPGAGDTEVALVVGGDGTDLKATLPAGNIGPATVFSREGVEAEADDLIQVTMVSNGGGLKDLSAVVAGYRTAELGP
jgi:hypothetical protein